jgi:TetR/AcrR family transcriptional regulator
MIAIALVLSHLFLYFQTSVSNKRFNFLNWIENLEKDTALKIIESATLLFADKGYHAVSVREVAKAADVNVSAISYYFAGKDGLYLETLEKQFEPVAAMLEELVKLENADALTKLWKYAQSTISMQSVSPYLMRFWHSELANHTSIGKDVLKKYGENFHRFFTATIAQGIDEGVFDKNINISHAALGFSGAMSSYCMKKPIFTLFLPELVDTEEAYLKQTFDIYINGLKPKKEEK